jgi:hypothetical protein
LADDKTVEDVVAQPAAAGVAEMGDPALDAGIQLGEADFPTSGWHFTRLVNEYTL